MLKRSVVICWFEIQSCLCLYVIFQMKPMDTLLDFLDSQFTYRTKPTKMKVHYVLRTTITLEPQYPTQSTYLAVTMEDTSSTTTTELILPTLMGILSLPTTSSVKWKCMVSICMLCKAWHLSKVFNFSLFGFIFRFHY